MNIFIFNREDAFFVDNAKYCFLSLMEEKFGGDIYYLVSSKFKKFFQGSFSEEFRENFIFYGEENFITYPKADWIIVDNWFLEDSYKIYSLIRTEKTRILQLWHGIPIKNVALVKDLQEPRYVDYAISTSEDLISIFSTFLDVSEFLVSNYFRNLCFINYKDKYLSGSDEEALEFIDRVKWEGKRVCFYMPTFRWKNFSYLDIIKFLMLLRKIALKFDIVFVVKLHAVLSELFELFGKELNGAGVFVYKPYLDVYPVLRFADLLITDYSSIVFDFLYLEKPVIFYFPDFDYRKEEMISYTAKIYEFFPLAKNFSEFIKLIKKFLRGDLFFDLDIIRNLRKEFFSTDGVLDIIKLMES